MIWTNLEEFSQLTEVMHDKHVVVFKHSTRCLISSFAKKRFERNFTFDPTTTIVFYLDIIRYRTISNELATLFSVTHHSPQLLVIKEGTLVYHASHEAINAATVADVITN